MVNTRATKYDEMDYEKLLEILEQKSRERSAEEERRRKEEKDAEERRREDEEMRRKEEKYLRAKKRNPSFLATDVAIEVM